LETDEFARQNALIRFYYHTDPNTLTDDEWARSIEEILWVLKFNGTIQVKK
jgi:carboxylesterase type B